jgi:hypothetical protein
VFGQLFYVGPPVEVLHERYRLTLAAKYGWRFWWFALVTLIGRARAAGGRPVGVEIVLLPR